MSRYRQKRGTEGVGHTQRLVDQVTLVVSSVDSYSGCWPAFIHGLRKYWPDCPFEVVFVTNYKCVDAPGIRTQQVGEDRGWAQNLLAALARIDTPYVLYAQEDYWLDRRVDTAALLEYLSIIDRDLADHIRLYPGSQTPLSAECPYDARLATLGDRAPYRASLQMAFWRKSVLLDLIDPAEDAWQFEGAGTCRSRKYEGRFLCVKRRSPRFLFRAPGVSYPFTAVVRGRWSAAARLYAQREKLTIDFSGLQSWPDTRADRLRRRKWTGPLWAAATPVLRPIYKWMRQRRW